MTFLNWSWGVSNSYNRDLVRKEKRRVARKGQGGEDEQPETPPSPAPRQTHPRPQAPPRQQIQAPPRQEVDPGMSEEDQEEEQQQQVELPDFANSSGVWLI